MLSTRNALFVKSEKARSDANHRHIVRRFLAWAQQSDVGTRAEAASALARSCLSSTLSPALRDEITLAATSFMDDPCVDVRRALAEAVSGARNAPRHLVIALANDEPEIAAAVLARSPLLTDAELVDCAATAGFVAQFAIARRPFLGVGPAAALAEVGQREAVLALIANPTARLTPGALRRLFVRFEDDPEIREALLARRGLPASLKAELALATTNALADIAGPGWTDRKRSETLARETRDATLVAIAAECPAHERAELARTLRERGALTIAVLLRSALSGERGLVAAALAELSGLPQARASAFVGDPGGQGFAALAHRAGLSPQAAVAFRVALGAIDIHGAGPPGGLKPRLVEATLRACEDAHDPALTPIVSLLWRFAAEAARLDVRASVTIAAAAPHLPDELAFAPANDYDAARSAHHEAVRALPAPAVAPGEPIRTRELPAPLQTLPEPIRARDAA